MKTIIILSANLLAIVLAVPLPSSDTSSVNQRVIGGKFTTIETFPYQVSVRVNNVHTCGASLISTNRVLTAAHCYDDGSDYLEQFTILVGSTSRFGDKVIVGVSKIIQHPKFRGELDYLYDIAVIWLEDNLTLSDKIHVINLPEQGEPIPIGEKALISGWGQTNQWFPWSVPKNLKYTWTMIISNAECKKMYSNEFINDDMICAAAKRGGHDACYGDSGGPLVMMDKKIQIGIVSFGIGCGNARYPGVYTRVASYRKWIDSLM